MNKLKLNLDALQVETFHTRELETVRGTVGGHYVPKETVSCEGSCAATCAGSCVYTCAGTCGASCQHSCAFTCESCGDPTCTHNSHFPNCV